MTGGLTVPPWAVWTAGFLLIWLPGALIARLIRLPGTHDWPAAFALQCGLGLAFWPLLLLWTSTLNDWGLLPGVQAGSARLLVFSLLAGSGALQIYDLWRNRVRRWAGLRRQWPWLLLFGFLLTLACYTRWEHIRQLILPNWVDSLHHTMIALLLVEQGRLPATYAPYISAGLFSYHWGFHALAAWLSWLVGATQSLAVAQVVLAFGQALNVLALPMLYLAGRILFNSRRAGFFAAALGMFVSWYPAYYVAWGRYTHLAGLLLLAPAALAIWKLAAPHPIRRGWWWLLVICSAGLILVHVRIAVFLVALALVIALVVLARRTWQPFVRWAAAAAATLLLVAPWLLTLSAHPRLPNAVLGSIVSTRTWADALAEIPWALVWVPGIRAVVGVATGGVSLLLATDQPGWSRMAALGWLLVIAGLAWWSWSRGRAVSSTRRALWGYLLLLAWGVTVVALLNLDLLGWRRLAFLTPGAVAISVFVPACLAAGGLLAWGCGLLTPVRGGKLTVVTLTTVILVAGLSVWGATRMRDVVNPETVLVDPADLTALEWVREHVPADAKFAVNTRRWLGNTYAGSDAGYWLPILTGRGSVLPPALYTITTSPAVVLEINEFLEPWAEVETIDAAEAARLQAAGVTHLFIGSRGGELRPDALMNNPWLRLIYDADSVYIFELQAPPR